MRSPRRPVTAALAHPPSSCRCRHSAAAVVLPPPSSYRRRRPAAAVVLPLPSPCGHRLPAAAIALPLSSLCRLRHSVLPVESATAAVWEPPTAAPPPVHHLHIRLATCTSIGGTTTAAAALDGSGRALPPAGITGGKVVALPPLVHVASSALVLSATTPWAQAAGQHITVPAAATTQWFVGDRCGISGRLCESFGRRRVLEGRRAGAGGRRWPLCGTRRCREGAAVRKAAVKPRRHPTHIRTRRIGLEKEMITPAECDLFLEARKAPLRRRSVRQTAGCTIALIILVDASPATTFLPPASTTTPSPPLSPPHSGRR